MADVLFIVIVIAFFAVATGLVHACEAMVDSE
jgi:hypothetical protein